jgi:murein DD-endopeptidase MepM/ murein hydrolase activator NlpD
MDGTVRNKMASPAAIACGNFRPGTDRTWLIRLVPITSLALLLAGCSSDVTRFDYPSFGLTGNSPKSSRPATGPASGMKPMQSTAQDYADSYEPAATNNQGYAAQPAAPYGQQTFNPSPQGKTYGQSYGQTNTGSGPIYRPYSGPAYKAPASSLAAGQACGANPCEEARSGVLGYGATANANVKSAKIRTASLEQSLPPLPPGAPRVGLSSQAEPLPEQGNFGTEDATANNDVAATTDGATAPVYEDNAAVQPPAAAPYVPPAKLKSVAKTGATILVGNGDTLYRIARDYGVSVSALMAANKLSTPAVTPGQEIFIPGAKGARALRERRVRPPVAAEAAAEVASAPAAAVPAAKPLAATPKVTNPAAAQAAATAPGGATYTVRGGDSFYGIAKKLNVNTAALAQANGLTDVTRIKQGQVLRVPTNGAQVAATAPAVAPATNQATETMLDDGAESSTPASSPQVPIKLASNGPVKSAPDLKTSAAGSNAGRFRWPVRGRVIAKFNQSASPPNEGIDLAVPLGTEVHVAEDGTVAYAGDELPGYGNIVLVRHPGGWVTAYAHNDQILVSRGATVKRGDVIAKAGKTGRVDQPMLHFELRKGGTEPVDPLPYLAMN